MPGLLSWLNPSVECTMFSESANAWIHLRATKEGIKLVQSRASEIFWNKKSVEFLKSQNSDGILWINRIRHCKSKTTCYWRRWPFSPYINICIFSAYYTFSNLMHIERGFHACWHEYTSTKPFASRDLKQPSRSSLGEGEGEGEWDAGTVTDGSAGSTPSRAQLKLILDPASSITFSQRFQVSLSHKRIFIAV